MCTDSPSKKFMKLLYLGSILSVTLLACEQQQKTVPPITVQKDALPSLSIVNIDFWHGMTGEPEKTLEQIVNQYNASNTSVHINLVNQGNYTSLQQKLMASAKTNTMPAIAQTFIDWNAVFVENGLVSDLTPFIDDSNVGWTSEQLEDIYPVFRKENTINGKLYSLPFNKSASLLFYNKTILEKNNIPVPTTWKELQDTASKLTIPKPEGQGKQVGMGFENSLYTELQNYVVQAGGQYIDLKSEKPRMLFNSAEGHSALSFLRGMLESGTARLAGEDSFMTEPFSRGDVVMYIGSSAGISFINNSVGSKFEWFAATPPKGKVSVANISGTNISLFSNTNNEQKQAAWDFIKFLLNTENSALWAEKTGYLPIRESVQSLDSYQQFIGAHPAQGVAVEQLKDGEALSRVPNALTVEPLVSKEVEAVLLGKKNIDQGLADAEKSANNELVKITKHN